MAQRPKVTYWSFNLCFHKSHITNQSPLIAKLPVQCIVATGSSLQYNKQDYSMNSQHELTSYSCQQ